MPKSYWWVVAYRILASAQVPWGLKWILNWVEVWGLGRGLTIIHHCLALESDTKNGEKNVVVEMRTKEFFQFLHQIENIKYCLSTVQNN